MSDRPARPTTIPALDSMRFLGVLAILLTHVGFHAGIYTTTGVLGHLASRLAVGVAVFFVLSGFLLAREWLVRAVAEQPAPSAAHYYWKRLWRIYPAYVVVVAVILIAFPANHDRGASGWIRGLLMLDPYTHHPLPDGFTQTWSLTTEIAFYLVLPPLMWLMIGRRIRRWRLALVLGCLAVASIVWLVGPVQWGALATLPAAEWLPAYLSWFAAGIGLAVLHAMPGSSPRLTRAVSGLAASPGACWTLAIALLLMASTPLAGPWLVEPLTPADEVIRHLLYLGVGVLVIVPAAFGRDSSRWVRLLSQPWARHLGHISYSVFLVHMGMIQLVMWVFDLPEFGGHFVEILALSLLASIVVAEALYRLVERPLTRVGHRSTRDPRTTPSAPSAR